MEFPLEYLRRGRIFSSNNMVYLWNHLCRKAKYRHICTRASQLNQDIISYYT